MERCLKKHVVCKYHWSDYTTPDPKHFLAQASSLDLFLLVFLLEFPVLLARYYPYTLEEEQFVRVQQWLQLGYLYTLEGKTGFLVRRLLQPGFPDTQLLERLALVPQLLQLGIPDTQLVVRLALVPLWHLIEYLYILVFQLFQSQQSLPLEFLYTLLYTLVLAAPVQALRLFQTPRLYRLVCQSFLVPPKPQTGRPQPLAQLVLVRRWHQLGFPDIQVVERLARVQRLLLLGCLYILVFQLFQGQQPLPLARLYILEMEPAFQALLFLQAEVLHSAQLPS